MAEQHEVMQHECGQRDEPPITERAIPLLPTWQYFHVLRTSSILTGSLLCTTENDAHNQWFDDTLL